MSVVNDWLTDGHNFLCLSLHVQDTLQSRPHELEEAIKSFETPKARIPFRLHNRPGLEEEPGSHTDAEDEEKEGGRFSVHELPLEVLGKLHIMD